MTEFYRESWRHMLEEEREQKAEIRHLNDELRKNGPLNGNRIICTGDLAHDEPILQMMTTHAVSKFTDFNEDNDPWGEHDFGRFTVAGKDFNFKIDYYDRDMKHGSAEPWNSKVTKRVLTICYAHDA